jgi:putative nucleotidyltransferase with HDIG domain
MRSIAIEDIKDGQIIAKNVYDKEGRLLLKEGTIVKKLYIKRLEDMGLPFVYVKDELLENEIEKEDLVSDSVKVNFVRVMMDMNSKIKSGKEIDSKEVHGIINKVLEDVNNSKNLIVSGVDFYSDKIKFFVHSLNVSVLSILIGKYLGYNDFQIKDLALGAMLHDIGKIDEDGEGHPEKGFEILKKIPEIKAQVAHIAFQHHENFDGSGFPRGLRGDDIQEYSKIVAIANYYDNLSFMNPDKERMYPYQALEKIMSLTRTMFDPKMVDVFTKHVAPFPVGSFVRLSNLR